MSDLITHARNATLEDMLGILKAQHAQKLDLVLPASKIRFDEGALKLSGLDALVGEDGVTDPNGLYTPTEIFDEKIAEYLDIPRNYVRKMRAARPDLYDANVNGWLAGRKAKVRKATAAEVEALATEENDAMFAQPVSDTEERWMHTLREAVPGDDRKFLLRLFQGGDGAGVARAILSNRYRIMENLDFLMAMLSGLKEAGIDPAGLKFDRCDLTERRMYVKVSAPEVAAMAPELLKGYRNPFGQGNGNIQRADNLVRGRDIQEWRRVAEREGMAYTEEEGGEPVVFAGFIASNSEVGGGMLSVRGCIEVQICKNGLTFAEDKFGQVHLGARMDEGVINWSAETQEANLALVRNQTKDAVMNFLSKEYVEAKIEELEQIAGKPMRKPVDEIKAVTKKLAFSDADTSGILEHFMLGGQITAGGLMQAITSYSQTVVNPDVAHDLEAKAVKAMELAAQ